MSLLYPNQYVHVLNNDTGIVRLIVGPTRYILSGNESLIGGVKKGTIVKEDEYAVVKNPFDEKNKKYLMGERKIYKGPCVLYLNYNSRLEEKKKIHILYKGQALKIKALQSHGKKKAGEIWQVEGPCAFVPTKYQTVLSPVNTILINDGEGIYIKNTDTSKKILIKGPKAYLLKHNEEFFYKDYNPMEVKSLKLGSSSDYRAHPIHLKKGQVVCILDENKKEKFLAGPASYLLEPEEHVKVLQLAKGKPKVPYQIKACIINLGPDFVSDRFEVQTKDNAILTMLVTYKWEFLVDENQYHKVFSMTDFIGYSCTTLTSLIREEVSNYMFEDFHKNSVGLIRNALFKKFKKKNSKGVETTHEGYYFDEIAFLITEIDVKEVKPKDKNINQLLNQSIKNNMEIVCDKMMQEAQLLAQKEKIKNDKVIAGFKTELITISNANLSLETIEKAKIDGKVKLLESEYSKKIEELETKANQGIEIERMKRTIELLKTEEGKKYLELLQAENLASIKQNWYITSEDKMKLL